MTTPSRPACRAAFTIVELLVVITIIIVIGGLSIGAVFTLRESQVKNSAETTVQKLAGAFDQQWKAVLDQAYDETVPDFAMRLANNDRRRARVIFLKARLRQEFPVNFTQAKQAIVFAAIGGGGLPAQPTYAQALANVTTDPPWSSAAMLYMILKSGRRGMAAGSPETLVGESGIQTGVVNGQTFPYFVDPWGNPVRLFTFPTGNLEIDAPPYFTPIAASPGQGRDVQDPEDTLMSAAWPAVLRNNFQLVIHALPPAGQPAHHLMPVIASSGKDGLWGVDPITMAVTDADQASDNIYSYRLRRAGQRGD